MHVLLCMVVPFQKIRRIIFVNIRKLRPHIDSSDVGVFLFKLCNHLQTKLVNLTLAPISICGAAYLSTHEMCTKSPMDKKKNEQTSQRHLAT